MSSSTDTSSLGRFGTFFVDRFPRRVGAPWSHSAKVLLWVGLAGASWAVVIFAGYFVWSVL